jgi:hypothetical protein
VAWSCCESGGDSSDVKCVEDRFGGVVGEEALEVSSRMGESMSSIDGLALGSHDMVVVARCSCCLDGLYSPRRRRTIRETFGRRIRHRGFATTTGSERRELKKGTFRRQNRG